jgi:hypothetical protein
MKALAECVKFLENEIKNNKLKKWLVLK